MGRRMRLVVYCFAAFLVLVIAGSVVKAPSPVTALGGIIGLFVTVKLMMIMTALSAEKVLGWWESRSLSFYRLWSLALIAVGVMLAAQ